MKYCIGCKHLQFTGPEPDTCMGSTLTGAWGGHGADMSCTQDHWFVYIDGSTSIVDLEEAMKHAEGCHDYEERENEQAQ